MYLRNCFLTIFFVIPFLVFSQNKEEKDLLIQATAKVFSSPVDAKKIASHLQSNFKQDLLKVQAFQIEAISDFVQGKYDESLKHAFQARSMAEKKSDVFIETTILISDILRRLQLKNEADWFLETIKGSSVNWVQDYLTYINLENLAAEKQIIKLRDIVAENSGKDFNLLNLNNKIKLRIAELYNEIGKNDSALLILQDPNLTSSKGYWEIQSLSKQSRVYFNSGKYDSAVLVLKKALHEMEKANISNPYELIEVHRNLAANYLVLEKKDLYHEHNQLALSLKGQIDLNENNATNTAYQLILSDGEANLEQSNNNIRIILIVSVFIVFLLIGVKFIQHYRNKNKIKNYKNLLHYLKKREVKNEIVISIPNQRTEPEVVSSLIPKEVENTILEGLRKFEESKKFTSHDISLGVLASQLNTNTKYLTYVIKTFKQKNFKSYINDLRVNYIVQKIKSDPAYLNYKVSYLAQESGFISHSTFTIVFKSIVGVSPIVFIEYVKEEIYQKA